MSGVLQQFGFLVEALDQDESEKEALAGAPRRPGAVPRDPGWIELPPAGISYLTLSPEQPPRVLLEPPARMSQAAVLETVRREQHPYLVMLGPTGQELRVNGVPAPPLVILHVRDQVQMGENYLLHLSLFRRPYIGPPAKEYTGSKCLVCRLPVAADTTIYICPNCSGALHCEGEEKSQQDRLECARLSSGCPRCGNPVIMTEGYAYVPEL